MCLVNSNAANPNQKISELESTRKIVAVGPLQGLMLRHIYPRRIRDPILRIESLTAERNQSYDLTYRNGRAPRHDYSLGYFKRGLVDGCSPETTALPSQSQIVIAGAGTVANSVAYHLVLNGWNDVLVLEQDRCIDLVNNRCISFPITLAVWQWGD